jgi:hypothetical protein
LLKKELLHLEALLGANQMITTKFHAQMEKKYPLFTYMWDVFRDLTLCNWSHSVGETLFLCLVLCPGSVWQVFGRNNGCEMEEGDIETNEI